LQGSGSKNHSAIIDYRKKAIGGIGKVKMNELPKPREGRSTTYLRMRLRGDRQRIETFNFWPGFHTDALVL
jgi:hypothetical protein